MDQADQDVGDGSASGAVIVDFWARAREDTFGCTESTTNAGKTEHEERVGKAEKVPCDTRAVQVVYGAAEVCLC